MQLAVTSKSKYNKKVIFIDIDATRLVRERSSPVWQGEDYKVAQFILTVAQKLPQKFLLYKWFFSK